jgi:hypothetical protein
MCARLQMQAMAIAGPGGKITYLDDGEVRASAPRQDSERAWNLWRSKALAQIKSEK